MSRLYNHPLLMLRGRGRGKPSRFIPASGMCRHQALKLMPKLLASSTYGKMGHTGASTLPPIYEPGVFYYVDTDNPTDASLEVPFIPPELPKLFIPPKRPKRPKLP